MFLLLLMFFLPSAPLPLHSLVQLLPLLALAQLLRPLLTQLVLALVLPSPLLT